MAFDGAANDYPIELVIDFIGNTKTSENRRAFVANFGNRSASLNGKGRMPARPEGRRKATALISSLIAYQDKDRSGTMKRLAAAIATTLFAAGAGATDLYQGFAEGNPDLRASVQAVESIGVQPGVGDSVDRYHGWADGNPDLFNVDSSGRESSGEDPDIYMSVSGNPDLHF